MSGLKNLKLLAQIRGIADESRIREVIRRVGLDPDDKKPVRKYSLGMRHRLGIAQAIMERPKLLLPSHGWMSSVRASGLEMDAIWRMGVGVP